MSSQKYTQFGQSANDWTYWKQTDECVVFGHWIIEIEEGKPPRMYCDDISTQALGVSPEESPEDFYSIWQENIFSSHIAEMQRHVRAMAAGTRGDITYPWKSPAGSTKYLRSIGVRDLTYQKGIRLLGTFQDVTGALFSERMSRNSYLKSDFLLQILADTFEAVHVIQFDKGTIMSVRSVLPLFWNECELDIAGYLNLLPHFLPPEDCKIIEKCIAERKVIDKNGNCATKYSWNFKSDAIKKDAWYNIQISLDPDVSKNDMIIAVRDISELEQSKHTVKALRHISEIDGLTKIFNRSAIEEKINEHLSSHPDENSLLLLLDLDNFKQINDQFGHIEGDNLLIDTAEKLGRLCRNTDKVGRLGGDEFIIFLRSVQEKDTDSLVSRILARVRKEYHQSSASVEVTASIGIARFPQDGTSFAELYHCADIALYDAKRRGKNQYSQYRKIHP